jgi:DNA mismatch repair ATPase MutS
MKVCLLYKDRDFELQQSLPWNEKDLVQDLGLNILLKAMAGNDEFLFEVVKGTVFSGLENNIGTIIYRQHILKDCLKKPSVVRLLYDIADGALDSARIGWFGVFSKNPSSILMDSIRMMESFVEILKQLREVAVENAREVQSEGFIRLFAMLQEELSDTYFQEINNHLSSLRFPNGILISCRLGKGNRGIDPMLHKFRGKKRSWLKRVFAKKSMVYTFNIHPRDDSGARALSALNNEGINLVANALAQSSDHIRHFFKVLKTELAFYIGCLNLHELLSGMQSPTCFPVPLAMEERKYFFKELYDCCLALKMRQRIIGNDMDASNKNVVLITGANQGGKSTFLRSVGLAQLMMQCGMFVPADYFSANICSNLFTHFKREEDAGMKSGKLDEELSRMSNIADHISAGSLFLFNESFAATNEKEGSEIAKQIVSILLEKKMQVFFVTHLYEFASNFYNNNEMGKAVFLRAERSADAGRTFKLTEGKPLATSYGMDVYNKVFRNKN